MRSGGQSTLFACTPLSAMGMIATQSVESMATAPQDDTALEAAQAPCIATHDSYFDAARTTSSETETIEMTPASRAPLFGTCAPTSVKPAAFGEEAALLLIHALRPDNDARNSETMLMNLIMDAMRCSDGAGFDSLGILDRRHKAKNALDQLRRDLGITWWRGYITRGQRLTAQGRRVLNERWDRATELLGGLDAVELAMMQSSRAKRFLAPLCRRIREAMSEDPKLDFAGLDDKQKTRITNGVAARFRSYVQFNGDIRPFYVDGRFTQRALDLIRRMAIGKQPSIGAAEPRAAIEKADMNRFTAQPAEAPNAYMQRREIAAEELPLYRQLIEEDEPEIPPNKRRRSSKEFNFNKPGNYGPLIEGIIGLRTDADPKFAKASATRKRAFAKAVLNWMRGRDILHHCVDVEGKLTDLGERAVRRMGAEPELLTATIAVIPYSSEGDLALYRLLPFTRDRLFEAVLDAVHNYPAYSVFEREQLRTIAGQIADTFLWRKISPEYEAIGDVSRYYDSTAQTFTPELANFVRGNIEMQRAVGGNILAYITGKIPIN